MSNQKLIQKKTGKAIGDFSMIKDKDKILICFSGGKDSFVLLEMLKYFKKKAPIKFHLKILFVNPGININKLTSFLEKETISYDIINYDIFKLVKEKITKRNNYCFLCSRIRRGLIYSYARENNFNKIALGHNLDDAIETSLLNQFLSYKTSFLKPKYLNDKKDITIIRPLIYCLKEEIDEFCKEKKYIPFKIKCPMQKKDSKREQIKKMIKTLSKDLPYIKESLFHSFENIETNTFWKKQK